MNNSTDWLLLVLTLPTENTTARMRFWRALKAMGCVALRDGAYLLPEGGGREATVTDMAEAIVKTGGTATVLRAVSRNALQASQFRELFDRSEQYADFERSLLAARKSLIDLAVIDINRLLRRLQREYAALRAADFFPGDASRRVDSAWTDFETTVATILSPGEPKSIDGAIARLNPLEYQGRNWATRRHLWVDRVASAWLIRRFIDPKSTFIWLDKPADCPTDALGFDFDGAAFTHVGDRVSFEVLLASFGLEEDRGLLRLGALVHALDMGGTPVPEASGFEAMMTGARHRAGADDDDQLLDDMSRVLDAFYAFYSTST